MRMARVSPTAVNIMNQNWVIQKVWGTQSPRKSGDMGIDGYSFMVNDPIQVKQSDSVGRNVVDNFEAAVERAGKDKGYIVAFSFTRGAREEVARPCSLGEEDGYPARDREATSSASARAQHSVPPRHRDSDRPAASAVPATQREANCTGTDRKWPGCRPILIASSLAIMPHDRVPLPSRSAASIRYRGAPRSRAPMMSIRSPSRRQATPSVLRSTRSISQRSPYSRNSRARLASPAMICAVRAGERCAKLG
jgi:hypothetical protein